MKVDEAEIVLKWSDGRTVRIGSISVEVEKEAMKARCRFRQRLGWEFVRKGFSIMLPGRKWRTSVGDGLEND